MQTTARSPTSVNGIAQTKPITRTVFGNLPVCTFRDAIGPCGRDQLPGYLVGGGAAPANRGWGLHFTHQGDIIFATWFTYDFDGTPLWLSATAQKISAGVYSGNAVPDDRTGVRRRAVRFSSRSYYTPVGTATLTFGNGDNATFAYTVTLG